MKFLGTLFLFAGYTLIYSAVANVGVFAGDPWGAILGDAYSQPGTSSTSGATGTTTAAGATPSPAAGVTGSTGPQVSKGRNRTITLPQTPTVTPGGNLAGGVGGTGSVSYKSLSNLFNRFF